MKDRGEIYVLQDLANLAKTLLDSGHPEARDAAQPIIAQIKAQFADSTEAAPQAEDTCNQFEAAGPNPHYDPIAAAAEELRLALRARDEAVDFANRAELEAERLAEHALEASRVAARAQALLVGAVEASNRA